MSAKCEECDFGVVEFLQMEFLQVVILTKLFLQEENLQRVIFP